MWGVHQCAVCFLTNATVTHIEFFQRSQAGPLGQRHGSLGTDRIVAHIEFAHTGRQISLHQRLKSRGSNVVVRQNQTAQTVERSRMCQRCNSSISKYIMGQRNFFDRPQMKARGQCFDAIIINLIVFKMQRRCTAQPRGQQKCGKSSPLQLTTAKLYLGHFGEVGRGERFSSLGPQGVELQPAQRSSFGVGQGLANPRPYQRAHTGRPNLIVFERQVLKPRKPARFRKRLQPLIFNGIFRERERVQPGPPRGICQSFQGVGIEPATTKIEMFKTFKIARPAQRRGTFPRHRLQRRPGPRHGPAFGRRGV